MAQNPSSYLLGHIARDVIVSIHDVLAPPHRLGHKEGDSVAISVKGEGSWSTDKYIL